jgi:hypothetical protein
LNDKSKIEELNKKQQEQEEVWNKQKKEAPDPNKAYKTALLGTGPSIANYLNVPGRSLDPKETVIIGKIQPWDTKDNPESRGIDFVNHPMHMTSPVRDQTKLPKEPSGADETFQGNPAELTEDIKKVLSGFKDPVNATITKVSRREDKWYKIETEQGVFYALK